MGLDFIQPFFALGCRQFSNHADLKPTVALNPAEFQGSGHQVPFERIAHNQVIKYIRRCHGRDHCRALNMGQKAPGDFSGLFPSHVLQKNFVDKSLQDRGHAGPPYRKDKKQVIDFA